MKLVKVAIPLKKSVLCGSSRPVPSIEKVSGSATPREDFSDGNSSSESNGLITHMSL